MKIKEKPINVSNTTLSYKARRHRKFDAKQTMKHNFGKTHCMICDEVFTKYHHHARLCSEECKRENGKAYRRKRYKEKRKDPEWVKEEAARKRKYREDNREKVNAGQRKHYAENREKILASNRKYYAENPEKILAEQRKYREENREKILAKQRKHREENRVKFNAGQRARYHAKKEE